MKSDGEKLATRGLLLLIVYAFLRCLFRAAAKPFWYDELCTVIIARQPAVSTILQALRRAADSHPPAYYLVERVADFLIPNQHIAFRLPSILGFCCIVVCIFVFVKKHSGAACALFCSALTLMSVFYDTYAVEARGYALMSACVAVALVCYQRADSKRWVLLMALSLAAASAFQYYAICALFPFVVAEAFFFLQTRRLRFAVWAAMACGAVPVIAFWPLLSALKKYYGTDFWARPALTGALSVFGWFFNLSQPWGIAMAALAAFGILATMVSRRASNQSGSPAAVAPIHEKVLVLSLLALPFAIFVAMKLTHGGMTQRYMLPACLGIPLAAGYILPRFDRRMAMLLGLSLYFGLMAQEGFFWLHQLPHLGKVVSPAQPVEEMLDQAGHQDLPIVVSDPHDYLQLAFYASPAFLARLVDAVDPPQAKAYIGSDIADKELPILRSYFPLQVCEFPDFAARHPHFLLYSGGGGEWDWWPTRLMHDRYSIRLAALRGNFRLYLVGPKEEISPAMNANIVPLALKKPAEQP